MSRFHADAGSWALVRFRRKVWTLAAGVVKIAAKQEDLSFITLTSSNMAARPWMIRTQKFYAGLAIFSTTEDPRPRRAWPGTTLFPGSDK